MDPMKRYLQEIIEKDLQKKMVFLGGPRQVGKTTLSKEILKICNGSYLNWDYDQDRSLILENELNWKDLMILDEIHKYKRWRNWIKGIYDKKNKDTQILITGSAQLDLYRHGGDSLQGRYHYHRLHPLSVKELKINSQKDFNTLMQLGGFPEPFFSSSQVESKRWSREYRTRLVREDIYSLENIKDLDLLEKLIIRLPALVGSPLSINSLREDLQIAHKTVAKWIIVLEKMFNLFRLPPLGGAQIRAVKKEQKHYHYDWTLIKENGPKFENLLACHLLKWVHHQEDTYGEDVELRYFRDSDGREVDFIILKDNEVKHMIEAKYSKSEISHHLSYLKKKYPSAQATQVFYNGVQSDTVNQNGIRQAPAYMFLNDWI